MTLRAIVAMLTVGLALCQGCATQAVALQEQVSRAPTQLSLGGEIGALVTREGYAGSVALNYEASGCCGVGTYINYSKLSEEGDLRIEHEDGADIDEPGVTDILEGGAELAAVVPWLDDRVRVRVRAGMAGTPPDDETTGRRGFGGGAAILFRLTDPEPPAVSDYASQLDLVVGGAAWSLSSARTAAGLDDTSASGMALYLGLRAGAGFGVDLQ